MSIVTLTTDFGADSPYVAQMKGVILGIAPATTMVDITHSIRPQDVLGGAIGLADAAFHFPQDTVRVTVVDPGVGSERAIVAAQVAGHWFVAPDNGLLTAVCLENRPQQIRTLSNNALWRSEVSATFHGRDTMAPIAAYLSRGGDPDQIGPRRESLQELAWPQVQHSDQRLRGEVLAIDSFGNIITNIRRSDLENLTASVDLTIEFGGQTIEGISRTYADHALGELIALFGSSGRLEIASVNGNAAAVTGATRGDSITLHQNYVRSQSGGRSSC